jgi:hypothetical protein
MDTRSAFERGVRNRRDVMPEEESRRYWRGAPFFFARRGHRPRHGRVIRWEQCPNAIRGVHASAQSQCSQGGEGDGRQDEFRAKPRERETGRAISIGVESGAEALLPTGV